MAVLIESYEHRTGEHCASTALRNILANRGNAMSEGMIFGLASGVGFFYLQNDALSPTRMFHGRTATLEEDFGANTALDFVEQPEPDDERAHALLREQLDAGEPVLLSTDTFYLRYHNTTSHFPGHRCVAIGYDDESRTVWIADRKFEEYQRCSYAELGQARNAADYPMTCENRWGRLGPDASFGLPLADACRAALLRSARHMLEPDRDLPGGVPAMRLLAKDLPTWTELPDWSWAARFGYQVVERRGAAGSFFRTLFRDFLCEATPHVPEIGALDLPDRVDRIANGWRELAAVLKEQSERETCAPELFVTAGRLVSGLADAEESVFTDATTIGDRVDAG